MTKEEIKKEIAECEEKLKSLCEELDKPEYLSKRWKPEWREQYYCLTPTGAISGTFFKDVSDAYVCAQGNCFKTIEEAEFEAERRKVITELSDFAEGDEASWDGATWHWYIYYCFPEKRMLYDHCTAWKTPLQLYFPSKEAAEAAVKAVGKERVIKYYFGIK